MDLVWHYIVCSFLLYLCSEAKKYGEKRKCFVICVLLCLVAVVGFITVYLGPFAASGWNFFHYVTRYAIFTLPVLLFPVVGISMYRKMK